MAQGGVKFLRGQVRDYVSYFVGEDGRGCLDHGYYGDGHRWVGGVDGVRDVGEWTPASYGAWLSGVDPDTGERRGSKIAEGELRSGVRGYEYGVNVPKSASVVAALDADLGVVLRAAQERAAHAGVAMLRRRARVRVEAPGVGDRRVQQLLEVDELEVAVFSHEGSRDGDPHQHLHVQVGAKAFVAGRWRSLAGRQMLASLGEWQATVGAALATDPEWTRALAERGLSVGPDGGVVEVPREVEVSLSRRDTAIRAAEEVMVAEHHAREGRMPTARELVWIHEKAWRDTRSRKGDKPVLDLEQVRAVVRANGGRDVLAAIDGRRRQVRELAGVDVPAAVQVAQRLAGEKELLSESELAAVAATAVAHTGGATGDLAGVIDATRLGLRAACVAVDLPFGETGWMPTRILAAATRVHEHLTTQRATATPQAAGLAAVDLTGLTAGQAVAAQAVAAGLPCVIEGPAGTGKTTALHRAVAARSKAGLSTFAVSKSAAAVKQLGTGWTSVSTADGMLVKAGWTRDEVGEWLAPTGPVEDAAPGSVLVVDEAAMMDLPTLSAVVTHGSRIGARVVLVGDDRQLSAVGAAGGFTVAARGMDVITLSETKRFTNPEHEAVAAAVRASGDLETVVEQVMAAGLVRRHDAESDALVALAEAATSPGAIVMAGSNETASAISRLARAERAAAGDVHHLTYRLGRHEEQIGVGDVIQTRSNNRDLGVRNRDRFVVAHITDNGGLTVRPIDGDGRVMARYEVTLPADYVAEHVHHADAVTVHAAQGATGDQGHALVDDTWTREQAYVAITRGRTENVLHVVATDDDAVRDLLRGVLAHSGHARAEKVADIVTERLAAARDDIAGDLAEKLQPAAAGPAQPRVGGWGSSMFTGPAAPPPAPPAPGKGGPVL